MVAETVRAEILPTGPTMLQRQNVQANTTLVTGPDRMISCQLESSRIVVCQSSAVEGLAYRPGLSA
jgi:hypothetical protein